MSLMWLKNFQKSNLKTLRFSNLILLNLIIYSVEKLNFTISQRWITKFELKEDQQDIDGHYKLSLL